MAELFITDENLARLKGQVVLITGGSSGIGLAAVKLLLALDAKVFAIDRSPAPEISSENFAFSPGNVTSWESLRSAFNEAVQQYGHIDHVFANAGIAPNSMLLEDDFDADGNLLPPSMGCFDVNLIGVAYTVKLALHHIRKNPRGGSIVMTASAASFQKYPMIDYTASKHGVLGLMRGLYHHVGKDKDISVRVNSIAPSWTVSGMVTENAVAKAGLRAQPPEAAAKSALLLMADESRHGQLLYSLQGKYVEIEDVMAESIRDMLSKAPSVDRVGGGTEVKDFF